MNDIKALLAAISGRTERPENYEDLLLAPIADEQTEKLAEGSYPGWEDNHWTARRFFPAGMQWFRTKAGLPFNKFEQNFRLAAHTKILDEEIWHGPNALRARWSDDFGRPKLADAWAKHPVSFETAAKAIVTCELAAADMIKQNGVGPGGITSAGEIYGRMGIFPAVWNISGWGVDYVDEAEKNHPNFYGQLMGAIPLDEVHVIHDLKSGHTVSRELAEAVKLHAPPGNRFPVGRVRATPGTHVGSGSASHNEELDLN